MSELWKYNLEDKNSNHLIIDIYCSSITNTFYTKQYIWSVKTKNNYSYNLEDETIDNLDLSDLDKVILLDARNNLKSLKDKQKNMLKKLIGIMKIKFDYLFETNPDKLQ